jgi:hypothetical protein
MIVKAMTAASADAHIDQRLVGGVSSPETYEIGRGPREPAMAMVQKAREALTALTDRYDPESGRDRQEFDAEASVALHQALQVDVRVAAEPDFWRYLATAELFDVVMWRHGRDGEVNSYRPSTLSNDEARELCKVSVRRIASLT